MKNKLNVKSLAVGTIIGGLLVSGVGYASSQLTAIEVSMDPINFLHNGQQIELEDGTNSFIYDGTTYVPVRWLSETLGKQVEWDEGSRTISISDPVVEEEEVDEVVDEQATVDPQAELVLDKEAYAANDTMKLKLNNTGATSISFGTPFQIEHLEDGQWVEWPIDLFFTMQLIVLEENESYDQEIDLSILGLEEGTYRIVKSISDGDHKTAVELHSVFEVRN